MILATDHSAYASPLFSPFSLLFPFPFSLFPSFYNAPISACCLLGAWCKLLAHSGGTPETTTTTALPHAAAIASPLPPLFSVPLVKFTLVAANVIDQGLVFAKKKLIRLRFQ